MDMLMFFLANAKNMKFIMIYLEEAHADDTWPMGYGIQSAKTLDDRINNCNNLMEKYP
jgi:hypothetical protein